MRKLNAQLLTHLLMVLLRSSDGHKQVNHCLKDLELRSESLSDRLVIHQSTQLVNGKLIE